MFYELGSFGECLDPGKPFAFEKLERCTAAGGDVLDLVRHPGLLDGRDGIASADNGDGAGILCQRLRDAGGAAGKGRHFKHPHGSVPDDGPGFGDFCR